MGLAVPFAMVGVQKKGPIVQIGAGQGVMNAVLFAICPLSAAVIHWGSFHSVFHQCHLSSSRLLLDDNGRW